MFKVLGDFCINLPVQFVFKLGVRLSNVFQFAVRTDVYDKCKSQYEDETLAYFLDCWYLGKQLFFPRVVVFLDDYFGFFVRFIGTNSFNFVDKFGVELLLSAVRLFVIFGEANSASYE